LLLAQVSFFDADKLSSSAFGSLNVEAVLLVQSQLVELLGRGLNHVSAFDADNGGLIGTSRVLHCDFAAEIRLRERKRN